MRLMITLEACPLERLWMQQVQVLQVRSGQAVVLRRSGQAVALVLGCQKSRTCLMKPPEAWPLEWWWILAPQALLLLEA